MSAGRTWRAKEILRGVIGGGRTEPEILERYGRLLESLGERVEAGKYLFLSGVRIPEYAEAIALFRSRHARLRGNGLAAQFPAGVRRLRFEELPAPVQRELRDLGVSSRAFGRKPPPAPAEMTWSARLADRVLMGGAIAVLGLFLIALALGVGLMGRWVWNFFR